MNRLDSKTVVLLFLAIFGAIVLLLRHVDLDLYSREECAELVVALCAEYGMLCEQDATELQWETFARKVDEQLKPIIVELEEDSLAARPWPGDGELGQLARHRLPKAAASRGEESPQFFQKYLAVVHEKFLERETWISRNWNRVVDLWFFGMIVLDGALVVWLGYLFYTWPKFIRLPSKNQLAHFDEIIASHPDSARHRGIRAKMLAKAERFEEAIADVDWILEHKPPGVDLDGWQRWRETVTQSVTDNDSSTPL